MKQFCKKIAFFFLITFILCFVSDGICTKLIRQSKSRAIVVWEDLFESRINCDVIFLGSSRTCVSYNPRIIDSIASVNSYNLGMHGKMSDMDIIRYRLLTKYNKKPRCVVWDLYHRSFSTSNGWLDEQFTPYLFDDDLWNELKKDNHGYGFFDKYLPMYRYWKRPYIFKYAFEDVRGDQDPYKGFIQNEDEWNMQNVRELSTASVECGNDTTIIKAVSSTIMEMKSDDIIVILVISPLYIEGINKLNGLHEFVNTCEQLSVDNDCLFLNFLKDPLSADSTLFSNCMHLNAKGADLFSLKLAKTLDSIFSHR